MLSLKVLRFFGQVPQQQLPSPKIVAASARSSHTSPASEELSWPDIERRNIADRRQKDRRDKQQAILLETRKTQGRRRSPGRRITDDYNASPHSVHISIQG